MSSASGWKPCCEIPGAESSTGVDWRKLQIVEIFAAVESADQAAASSGDSAKKSEDPEITKLKEQVAQVAKDLDLLKRELVLDSDTFYSNTDYVHDKAGQTKLANEQQQINAKQQELDELKARLQDLEARKKPSEATASDKPKQ